MPTRAIPFEYASVRILKDYATLTLSLPYVKLASVSLKRQSVVSGRARSLGPRSDRMVREVTWDAERSDALEGSSSRLSVQSCGPSGRILCAERES